MPFASASRRPSPSNRCRPPITPPSRSRIGYILSTESTPDSFTVRRNYILGEIIFQPAQYPAFRTFYSKMENKDHESVVLTTAPVTAKASPTAN